MISIIIPTYNEEKYIGDTLAQFAGLKAPHEIIVTDDKSTDNTVRIAQRYADKVLVPERKHATIAANRNAGAQAASGDYFLFIDSSCLIQRIDSFFEKVSADFKEHPDLVGLTGRLHIYPETRTFGDRVMYLNFNVTHYVKNNILRMGEAPGKFQIVAREAFQKVHGYREDLVTREDADLFARLSKIGRTRYDCSIEILHSGRRAHAIGWPKLLSIWMVNTFWLAVFGKARTMNWERWWEKPVK
jgi:glycosyltransferase involved in cell wall biosynthesis